MMDHWSAELLHQLVHSKDVYHQLELLENLVSGLGFDFYAFSFITPSCSIRQSNYPGQWSDRYRRNEYAVVDPVLAHCQQSAFPLLWTPDVFAEAPELWADAQNHGLCRGWTQPFHDEQGRRSSLSVVRRKDPVSPRELYRKGAAVLWLVQVLHAAAATQLDAAAPSSRPSDP